MQASKKPNVKTGIKKKTYIKTQMEVKTKRSVSKKDGAIGKKEGVMVKKGGAISKKERTFGKVEGATGKKEEAMGKEEGDMGRKKGAAGKEEGATGKEEGEDLPFDFETAFLQAQFKHLFATISNDSDEIEKNEGATGKKEDAVRAKMMRPSRPSSNLAAFREEFARAKHIVVLTGAGVSAESGVPTFRGAGGFWRKWQAQDLASPEAFRENPSLVWEFYHHRREVMATKSPNPAHKAIAEAERRLATQGRKVVVITQNIDELHKAAGSQDITELHGSLFRVRCTKCSEVTVNRDSPICPALGGKGEPNPDAKDAKIPVEELPRCQKEGCGGLLRPDVIWFGESLNRKVLDRAFQEIANCDLCLVVGTSSVVYPAAMFAPSAAERGVPVAEFNIEATAATDQFGYMFEGPAGEWLPKALAPHPSEKK